MAWIDTVFFQLNRPEYARTPEMLASALARDLVVEGASTSSPAGGRLVGYVFEKTDKKERKTLEIRQTRPTTGEEVNEWVASLMEHGLTVPGVDALTLGNSLLDSLRGITAAKARGRAAVPLGPGTALLQDARGMHAKARPPNYGMIFNQLYSAGSPGECGRYAASNTWLRSASRPSRNPLLNTVAAAALTIGELGSGDIRLRDGTDNMPDALGPVPLWLSKSATPFSWYRQTWDTVCSSDWQAALPRRRWADWCATVLRTSLGLGFLWEARFFRTIVQQVLSSHLPPAEAASRALASRDPLLEWKLEEAPLGTRDVNSRMRRVIIDGVECRATLAGLDADELGGLAEGSAYRAADGLEAWIDDARTFVGSNDVVRKRLTAAFGQDERSRHANVIETVRYALSSRKEYGSDADLYGLLRTRSRRFRVVQPGPEWIVVVASLAAGGPGASTTLRELRRSLAALGLRPQREVLVRELERAGLTRSSHDADDAIEVHAGFGRVANEG